MPKSANRLDSAEIVGPSVGDAPRTCYRERMSAPAIRTARPWYLGVALALALLFGIGGWNDGCNTISEYRDVRDDSTALVEGLSNAAEIAAVEAATAEYIAVREAAKNRAFPLGVAAFLLGAALLTFSAQAMGGRSQARTLLVQLVVAQLVLVIATSFLTADVWKARTQQWRRAQIAHLHESTTDVAQVEQFEQISGKVMRLLGPTYLLLRTLASSFILIALTRSRTRAFFDAAQGPVSER